MSFASFSALICHDLKPVQHQLPHYTQQKVEGLTSSARRSALMLPKSLKRSNLFKAGSGKRGDGSSGSSFPLDGIKPA